MSTSLPTDVTRQRMEQVEVTWAIVAVVVVVVVGC
jgi:hypothetical protein